MFNLILFSLILSLYAASVKEEFSPRVIKHSKEYQLYNSSKENSFNTTTVKCTQDEELNQECAPWSNCVSLVRSNGTWSERFPYCKCPPGFGGSTCEIPAALTSFSDTTVGLIAGGVALVIIAIFVTILLMYVYHKKKKETIGNYYTEAPIIERSDNAAIVVNVTNDDATYGKIRPPRPLKNENSRDS